MNVATLVPPAQDLLSLVEAKAHLKVGDDEDRWLLDQIHALSRHLDGWEGILGKALTQQTLALYLDRFPHAHRASSLDAASPQHRHRHHHHAIRLPCPPLVSVTSITYVDGAGVTQTMDATAYQVDAIGSPARILPAYGTYWPAARHQLNAICITFVAGYAPGAGSPTDFVANVPRPILSAAKLLLGHLYENREATSALPSLQELPLGVQALLANHIADSF